jgi:hypothetical protein
LLGSSGNAVDARNSLGIGSVFSFRNLVINGNFAFNQRAYASGVATTVANQYTLDRWRVVTSGQNVSFGAGTPDVTVTAPAGGIEQVIEGANIAGGAYTLSWTGTATATVNGAAVTNGGNTASLPANTNVTLRFSGGTVTRVQLELGTVATPFERRHQGIELTLCQRYYETGTGELAGYNLASNLSQISIPFKVTKRVAPTITTAVTVATGISTSDFRNPKVDSLVQWSTKDGATGSYIFVGNWTASAEI